VTYLLWNLVCPESPGDIARAFCLLKHLPNLMFYDYWCGCEVAFATSLQEVSCFLRLAEPSRYLSDYWSSRGCLLDAQRGLHATTNLLGGARGTVMCQELLPQKGRRLDDLESLKKKELRQVASGIKCTVKQSHTAAELRDAIRSRRAELELEGKANAEKAAKARGEHKERIDREVPAVPEAAAEAVGSAASAVRPRFVEINLKLPQFAPLRRHLLERKEIQEDLDRHIIQLPFHLPKLSTGFGCDLLDLSIVEMPERCDEPLLGIHREPHPITGSTVLLCLHDRVHGGNWFLGTAVHVGCGHREANMVQQASGKNTGGSEQSNRSMSKMGFLVCMWMCG
jgi:hypothetical protein